MDDQWPAGAPGRSGMTLVEVISAVGLFTLLILSSLVAVISLSRIQQVNYQRTIGANVAMVLGHYRATDMIQRAMANYVAVTPIDATVPGFRTGQFAYWNSWSYDNPGATWYGCRLNNTASSQTMSTSGPPGTTWVDQCPLLETFTGLRTAGGSGYPNGFAYPNPPTSLSVLYDTDPSKATLDYRGGTLADRGFFRLHRLRAQPANGPFNLDAYDQIFVAFSQPCEPPAYAKVKARYVMMTVWSMNAELVYPNFVAQWWSANSNGYTLTFLGRYPILDALEP